MDSKPFVETAREYAATFKWNAVNLDKPCSVCDKLCGDHTYEELSSCVKIVYERLDPKGGRPNV